MNYAALLLNQLMERSLREQGKVIIGNPLPYIMLMSSKLLPLMKLVTEISILLTPLMRVANLITAGPDSPAFGSFQQRRKKYIQELESNQIHESNLHTNVRFTINVSNWGGADDE